VVFFGEVGLIVGVLIVGDPVDLREVRIFGSVLDLVLVQFFLV